MTHNGKKSVRFNTLSLIIDVPSNIASLLPGPWTFKGDRHRVVPGKINTTERHRKRTLIKRKDICGNVLETGGGRERERELDSSNIDSLGRSWAEIYVLVGRGTAIVISPIALLPIGSSSG